MAKPTHEKDWAFYIDHLGGYMHRWIARLRWLQIRIHHILRSDKDRFLHDHPFDFFSIILWGGYIEHREGCRCEESKKYLAALDTFGIKTFSDLLPNWWEPPCREYKAPAIIYRKAEDFHRIQLINDVPTWTLVFASRYFRKWGFLTDKGWIESNKYRELNNYEG